jgi:hypothetical protein
MAEAVGRYPEKNIGPALETGRGFFMVQADFGALPLRWRKAG